MRFHNGVGISVLVSMKTRLAVKSIDRLKFGEIKNGPAVKIKTFLTSGPTHHNSPPHQTSPHTLNSPITHTQNYTLQPLRPQATKSAGTLGSPPLRPHFLNATRRYNDAVRPARLIPSPRSGAPKHECHTPLAARWIAEYEGTRRDCCREMGTLYAPVLVK